MIEPHDIATQFTIAKRKALLSILARICLVVIIGMEIGCAVYEIFFLNRVNPFISSRDVLYAIQRWFLWPRGIHLNDQRWTKWHNTIWRGLEYVPAMFAVLGATGSVLLLALTRGRLRR